MGNKAKMFIFVIMLFSVLLYFVMQETGCNLNVIGGNLPGCFGYIMGTLLGNLAGAVVAVWIFLILKRISLKISFPTKIELFGLIIYTMIIISATRGIPK